MRSRVKFSDVKPEGARVVLTLWKPSACLRIRRRASSWWSRRRGSKSKSSSATSSRRERELCSSLGSHLLPVFEFAGARLCGVHGGEVRIESSSMWVGAQAWRRARARGDRSRLPIPFRRKTQPTAKPPPVIVVGAVDVADLGFRRLSLVREARVGAQGFTDLESRPKGCTSRMDTEHTREVRV